MAQLFEPIYAWFRFSTLCHPWLNIPSSLSSDEETFCRFTVNAQVPCKWGDKSLSPTLFSDCPKRGCRKKCSGTPTIFLGWKFVSMFSQENENTWDPHRNSHSNVRMVRTFSFQNKIRKGNLILMWESCEIFCFMGWSDLKSVRMVRIFKFLCEIGENILILIPMWECCEWFHCQMRFFEITWELMAKNFFTNKLLGVPIWWNWMTLNFVHSHTFAWAIVFSNSGAPEGAAFCMCHVRGQHLLNIQSAAWGTKLHFSLLGLFPHDSLPFRDHWGHWSWHEMHSNLTKMVVDVMSVIWVQNYYRGEGAVPRK